MSIVNVLCFAQAITVVTPQQSTAADDAGQVSRASPTVAAQSGSAVPATSQRKAVTLYSPKRANFKNEQTSREARQIADWVVDSGDNRRMPFVIVDKADAKVFVFYADGRIRGAARALLGLARGDDAVPGIGNRKMSSIRPEERTTPAGRFVASLGRNMSGAEILWVDYDTAISMHRVVTNRPKERRLQRLATRTPLDKRISYGCINVPAKFFNKVVRPSFSGTNGIVYVLPETRPAQEVFGSYDVEEHARQKNLGQAAPAPPAPVAGK